MSDNGEWLLGEVLNIDTSESRGVLYYYIHFLKMDKKFDDWIIADRVNVITELQLEKLNKSEIQFFQLSALNKQMCQSGQSSVHLSGHQDPYEHFPKTVRGIEFLESSHRIQAWYRSPFPKRYWSLSEYLQVCPRCLSFDAHSEQCPGPAGIVIYRSEDVTVREVSGYECPEYSERLFLIAKLFLEDKRTSPSEETNQLNQVHPFVFYVLSLTNERDHFIGYFSKYRISNKDTPILSCILVLPTAQRRGYGRFLISLSYHLARLEGRVGSAERPLSGSGSAAFQGWWSWRLKSVIEKCCEGDIVTIAELSNMTGMTSDDVLETLKASGALKQWGGTAGDVKLRESGKRAKLTMTMDLLKNFNLSKTSGDRQQIKYEESQLLLTSSSNNTNISKN